MKERKEVNLLNIFESILDLQRMIPIKTNKLFIDKETGILMSLSKYKYTFNHSIGILFPNSFN
jgi:hypothetical protein